MDYWIYLMCELPMGLVVLAYLFGLACWLAWRAEAMEGRR